MKNLYQSISRVIIVMLVAMIPFASMSQAGIKEAKTIRNTASCYKYWSVGAFFGLTQFHGDLSKNLLFNLSPNSMGYTAGFAVTKQFGRVVGVRARFAYGQLHSSVEDKWVWEYLDGNGSPQKITQSFRASMFESDLQVTVNWFNWIFGYKPERIFSSYLIAGIGLDHSSGTRYDANGSEIAYLGRKSQALNVGNTSGIGNDDLQFKVSGGIGFDLNLSKHFSVPIEFAWKWQNSDLLDMTSGGAQIIKHDMYSSATVGLTYKFGYSCPEVIVPVAFVPPAALVITAPKINFFVVAPKSIPSGRSVREVFPIRNYVFFDFGSTSIPDRYVLITSAQVKDFKEEQVELFTPKNKSGRSDRQMIVYYNILNILGDRMGKNPAVTIKLVGSTEQGPEDGRLMAESVKLYLVGVFGINASRITTEGRLNPKIPSEKPGGVSELDLLRAGDRRVSIESSSPVILMEFQSGPYAPLKPIEIVAMNEAPFESNVFINVAGAKEAFTSWSVEITDENGTLQHFGPYTQERVIIPGKLILGARPEGTYKVTMTGQAKNGMTVMKDTTVNMVLWTPPKNEEVMRFSVIYEFDESKAITIYERYLTDVVLPKIPAGGTVIIQGYTDVIGDEDHNQKLSVARANDVRTILENGLKKAGRTDVKFEVFGLGEDEKLSPFENKFPEERFYNRTVIIDIMPVK